MIAINCPACGGAYDGHITSRFITCEYCGTRFALSKDELDDLGFVDADQDGFDDNEGELGAIDDDGSFASMSEYAGEKCEAFLAAVDTSYFESSAKILRGLAVKDGHEVFLIHDDTLFKSGKNGFAITSGGLYCREMGERSGHFVSWDTFAAGGMPELDDSYIRQNGTSLCYFTDNNDLREGKIMQLYRQLYAHAQKVL